MTHQQDSHNPETTTTEIIAVVDNVIRLRKATFGASLLSEVRDSLTRENPAYHQMKRMQERNYRLSYMKLPPKTISSISEDDDTVYVPRGFKRTLIEICSNHNSKITFYDETIKNERDEGIQLNPNIELKDYQRRAISKLIISGGGILIAPCGGGKTVMGLGIINLIKQKTLILVHTHDLLSQWRRELAEKSILPGGVGVWGGGEKTQGQAIVATIQSLIRCPPNDLRQWLKQFGCVILDEAHHCPADTFMGVFNLCPAKFRFGLTATPKRKDGLEFLMHDVIGPIVSEVTDDDLTAAGRSQSCEVRNVITSFYTRYTADEWTKLLAELCNDVERNSLIVSNVLKDWNDGHFPIIISDRVPHCKNIMGQLKESGMNAHLLVGEVSKAMREQVVHNAKAGRIDAIVATKVADEGLDIPQLSCIHLVTPSGNESKIQQRVGRIRRPIEGKKSLVVDYQDLRVPSLLRMSKVRRSLYRRWGFTKAGGGEL